MSLPALRHHPALPAHVRIAAGLVAIGGALFVANLALIEAGLTTGVPKRFPISIFEERIPGAAALGWAVLFLALTYAGARSGALRGPAVWAFGLLLVGVGNLMQGDVEAAFRQPFVGSDIQYFQDALEVGAWPEWLATFNERQSGLRDHSRTHPPFAVLIHSFALWVAGGHVLGVSAVFVLLSVAAIPVVQALARSLGATPEASTRFAVLFAVVPAVNVYGAVSLDGVILTTSVLFLLGAVRGIRARRMSGLDAGLMAVGLVATNLLTYGGVFLLAAGLLLGVGEVWRHRRWTVLRGLALSGAALALALGLLGGLTGYDHVLGFLTASHLENPDGFRAFSEPLVYVVTRAECVSEIALFASLGVLTRIVYLARHASDHAPEVAWWVMVAGGVTLLAMFATGAFRTGETARAALFIYPYLLLPLATEAPGRLRVLILAAGGQTCAMQLVGDYFW